jgi:hypothetical protein
MRVPSPLGRFAAAAACGCLVVASAAQALPSPANASPADPSVSIRTSSALAKVSGDTHVMYKAGRYAAATVSGTVTGGRPGEVVALIARAFDASRFRPTGVHAALSRRGTYAFTVRPDVATTYRVQLISGHTIVAPSPQAVVYVEGRYFSTGVRACGNSRPICWQTLRVVVLVPPSAYKTEAAKRWFLYSGLRLGPIGRIPAPPRYLFLDRHGHATVSRPRPFHAREFIVTLRFRFNIGNSSYRLAMNYCTKDTERIDGLGLPGHHGCGAIRIRLNAGYLG